MMETTAGTDWKTRLVSWCVALAVVVCAVLGMRFVSGPSARVRPEDVAHAKTTRESVNAQIKHDQAHRVLPTEYAKQLVKQSETLVRRNLEEELRRFREMSDRMRANMDALLVQIEQRPLPDSAPPDANDTSAARAISRVTDTLPPDYAVDEIYELLRKYENEIRSGNVAVGAARQALAKGLSFPEVYRSMLERFAGMPSFAELVERQTHGDAWERNADSDAAWKLRIGNTEELNQYRGLLGQTVRQAGLADSRLSALFGAPLPPGSLGIGTESTGGNPSGSKQRGGPGGEGDPQFMFNDDDMHAPWSYYDGEKLSQELVKAQALPGRRFSRSAERKGWLYINTWYMIGPWESYGRGDFAQTHPPEVSIDLDAVYTDGMVGMGVAETDADPIEVRGPAVRLDGTLRWKFMQSESMHNVVPVTADHATYYAYTEIYFDEPETMLVAIGTDDSGKLWINGEEVWQDEGTSWYKIDEHIEPFDFRQGWNRILVRLENVGGSAAGFSLLIVPKE